MPFETATIVGVGLIGGSFGMALRERGLVRKVIGAARREETIHLAVQIGAIDEGTTDLGAAAAEADLVFMAPPVGQMTALCERIAPVIRPNAVVTDAGSTKAAIVRDCNELFSPGVFIGGHPMAGSEKAGVQAARANLYEGAVWILTPSTDTPADVTASLSELVSAVGATPLIMDAETHDLLLAVTSHLPHITASALVHSFLRARSEAEVAARLVASGWRDSTRIAAGSAELWRDISLANAPALVNEVDALVAELERVKRLLVEANGERLLEWFDKAAIERSKHF